MRCVPRWPPKAAQRRRLGRRTLQASQRQDVNAPFGVINAFKPPGPSSAAFGSWVRRISGASAVGHWGTLDPTACGVLVLALGKATRLLPLLPDARKRYVFELVPGARTTTGDATGEVSVRAPVPPKWASGLAEIAVSLVGPMTQIPPMHSAVKVDGRPLYQAARQGHDVPRAPRATTIHELRVIGSETSVARLYVDCAAGTYVRVLCEELGRRLDLPAHMGALLRVASGPFVLADSVRPDQIQAAPSGCIIDPLRVLEHPRVDLDDRGAQRFAHGNEIQLPAVAGAAAPEGAAPLAGEVLVTHAGALVGCGYLTRRDDTRLLAPSRVF